MGNMRCGPLNHCLNTHASLKNEVSVSQEQGWLIATAHIYQDREKLIMPGLSTFQYLREKPQDDAAKQDCDPTNGNISRRSLTDGNKVRSKNRCNNRFT